jgi:hypothetical protein
LGAGRPGGYRGWRGLELRTDGDLYLEKAWAMISELILCKGVFGPE